MPGHMVVPRVARSPVGAGCRAYTYAEGSAAGGGGGGKPLSTVPVRRGGLLSSAGFT